MAKVENVDVNKVKVSIEVSKEDFAAALQEAYVKSKGNFAVQGFRKGKVPKSVVENYYGEGIFFEDAFEIVFPDSYQKAVEELELVPVSRPDIDIDKIGKEDGIVYNATIFIKPDVELGEYKDVKAEKAVAKVDESGVQDEINRMSEQNVRWVDVERAAADKDKVVIDYSGSVDGELFDGGTAENQTLELGSGSFIPGFEEQVIGLDIGKERDITVSFPKEYQAEHLAGKEAVFHIKLHEVKEKEMPEVDDEFAQDVSEFDTLEEYKADILKNITEAAQKQADQETKTNVIKAVTETAKIDLPEVMIENQIDNQIQQMEYSMMYQGIKLPDYLKMMGTTMEALRADYKEPAESMVISQLVVEAIQKAEKIEASDEQVEAELVKRAEQYKKELDEYKKQVEGDELSYIKDNLGYDNTVAFLVENAELKVAKKKPAKKAAAKKDEPKKENNEEK
ncbi:MAG: trigger factor [Clostridia bacterium]|nr:trigger factor [Clostridia bacterium]